MYNPAHFALSDVAAIQAFLRTHVFAVIAGEIGGAIHMAYAPVVLDKESTPLGRLRFHLALANPLAGIEDGAPLKLSIMGPHAYVSPDWYASDGLVPTWNYMAVEVAGRVRRLSDVGLRRLLSDLTAQEESALAPKAPWKMSRAAPDRLEVQLRAIVGFELSIDALEGKAKLSQNRTLEDAKGVIAGLETRGDAQSAMVAAAMREMYMHKGQ